jgi:hypothetical protein
VEGWRFDAEAGRELVHIRCIGRNELAAMQAALAYHDAQIEYALADRDGDGVLEYYPDRCHQELQLAITLQLTF